MTVLNWLLKKKPTASVENPAATAPSVQSAPTDKDIFRSPTLLAQWVNKWLLESMPLADYYSQLPDEESRKSFNMTFEQRERYIREIAILRISGISLFIKDHHDDDFWLTFSTTLYPFLTRYLHSDAYSNEKVVEVAGAVEEYVSASAAKDEEKMSSLYMRRVYDDSDHYIRLKAGGVGFLSVQWLSDSYSVFRDAHCKVTQGLSYESFRALAAAQPSKDL